MKERFFHCICDPRMALWRHQEHRIGILTTPTDGFSPCEGVLRFQRPQLCPKAPNGRLIATCVCERVSVRPSLYPSVVIGKEGGDFSERRSLVQPTADGFTREGSSPGVRESERVRERERERM